MKDFADQIAEEVWRRRRDVRWLHGRGFRDFVREKLNEQRADDYRECLDHKHN
jgi:hypothetical protein